MDPKVWDEPEQFRPDRFLDKNGEVVGRELIMPFSTGMWYTGMLSRSRSLGLEACFGQSQSRLGLENIWEGLSVGLVSKIKQNIPVLGHILLHHVWLSEFSQVSNKLNVCNSACHSFILLWVVFSDVRYMSSSVRLSIVCLSVTFVHTTQAIKIFGNVSTPFGTLAIC